MANHLVLTYLSRILSLNLTTFIISSWCTQGICSNDPGPSHRVFSSHGRLDGWTFPALMRCFWSGLQRTCVTPPGGSAGSADILRRFDTCCWLMPGKIWKNMETYGTMWKNMEKYEKRTQFGWFLGRIHLSYPFSLMPMQYDAIRVGDGRVASCRSSSSETVRL